MNEILSTVLGCRQGARLIGSLNKRMGKIEGETRVKVFKRESKRMGRKEERIGWKARTIGRGSDAEAGKPGWRRNRQTEGICWKLHQAYRILNSETDRKVTRVSRT
jgi:hypothetical protein